jgi:hypothetical protein
MLLNAQKNPDSIKKMIKELSLEMEKEDVAYVKSEFAKDEE